jgi:zinc transporter ZupT
VLHIKEEALNLTKFSFLSFVLQTVSIRYGICESFVNMNRFLVEDELFHNETYNETGFEDDHADDEQHYDKPWGDVIAASFIIQLVTFSGLFALSFARCFQRLRRKESDTSFWTTLHHAIIPSFASGALLATTVFLLIPEGLELLEGGHAAEYLAEHAVEDGEHMEETEEDNKNTAAWKFGASLIGGFLFPILLGAVFPPPDTSGCAVCVEREREASSILSSAAVGVITEKNEEETNEENEDESSERNQTLDLNCDDGECTHHHNHDEEKVSRGYKKAVEASSKKEHPRNWPLACSILVGDGFHNFCDGIFIGNAFLLCDRSLAYTMVATTVYHELAQEIADYALLTHHCGLTNAQALSANFVSGFSTMLGGILILLIDLTDTATGSILIMSAGVYLYIAACECIPRIQESRKTPKDTLLFLVCFVIGAVPIGLVLLNHGHCDEEH